MRKHSYKYGLVLLTTVATLCSTQAGSESEKIKPVLFSDLFVSKLQRR